ncbi:MAG: hypothetical protein AAFX40_01345 [Cyanobacteria bacterium J06639_1]
MHFASRCQRAIDRVSYPTKPLRLSRPIREAAMRRRQVVAMLVALGVGAANRQVANGSDGVDSGLRGGALPVRGQSDYVWSSVALGGGGYVTGVYLHPRDRDSIYIKTDVGGAYRWLPREQRWLPLTNWLPRSLANHYGCESLALDPQNPDLVYLAAGKFLFRDNGTIYKSSDRGSTWTKLDLDLPMGGNEELRWVGERLAVDPFDSRVLLFGSRRDGLWRSRDAGANWQSVPFPGNVQSDIGITEVAFDPNLTGRVFAIAYGDGIYRSDDRGLTWQRLSGSPRRAHRLAIASSPTPILYATHAKGVARYRDRVWTDITPPDPATPAFNALAIDPFAPDRLLVVYDQYHDRGDNRRVFLSENRGESWQAIVPQVDLQVPWWNEAAWADAAAAIAFDPHVRDRVWLTDWSGVWQTTSIGEDSTWRNLSRGHEELVTFALLSLPRGAELLCGVADADGFRHESDLAQYPRRSFGGEAGPWFQDTYSLAACETEPERLARVGGNRYNSTFGGATSDDGGKTWQAFAEFPTDRMPLRVAVSASNPDLLVVTLSRGTALRSPDRGRTWTAVQGLPRGDRGPWYWAQSLAADKQLGNTFYYYARGTLYRSDDGGNSFAIANTSLPAANWHAIETTPGRAGELWLSLGDAGLLCSGDRGSTFEPIRSVKRAHLFAIAPRSDGRVFLYVYGEIAGMEAGIFRSGDRGRTWQAIDAPRLPIGNEPNVMIASRQRPDVVFIGTGGSGIYYGKLAFR